MPSFFVVGVSLEALKETVDEMQETGISKVSFKEDPNGITVTFNDQEWLDSLKAVGNEDLTPNGYAKYLEDELRDWLEIPVVVGLVEAEVQTKQKTSV